MSAKERITNRDGNYGITARKIKRNGPFRSLAVADHRRKKEVV